MTDRRYAIDGCPGHFEIVVTEPAAYFARNTVMAQAIHVIKGRQFWAVPFMVTREAMTDMADSFDRTIFEMAKPKLVPWLWPDAPAVRYVVLYPWLERIERWWQRRKMRRIVKKMRRG